MRGGYARSYCTRSCPTRADPDRAESEALTPNVHPGRLRQRLKGRGIDPRRCVSTSRNRARSRAAIPRTGADQCRRWPPRSSSTRKAAAGRNPGPVDERPQARERCAGTRAERPYTPEFVSKPLRKRSALAVGINSTTRAMSARAANPACKRGGVAAQIGTVRRAPGLLPQKQKSSAPGVEIGHGIAVR